MTPEEIKALNLDPDRTPVFALGMNRLPNGGLELKSHFVGYDDGKGTAADGVLRFSNKSPRKDAA